MDVLAAIVAAIEGGLLIASAIDPIITNYNDAPRLVASLTKRCRRTQGELKKLRSALEDISSDPDKDCLEESHLEKPISALKTFYDAHSDFDKLLSRILGDLGAFRFDDGRRSDLASRVSMIWRRPRIEDMKREINDICTEMLLLIATVQMQQSGLASKKSGPFQVPASNEARRQALFEAISFGYKERVRTLLDAGASTEEYVYQGFRTTPLHVAAEGGYRSIVERLLRELEERSGIDAQNQVGETPLMRAVSMVRLPTVRCLLKNHARVDITDNLGRTVLHHAVASKDAGIVRKLLSHKPGEEAAGRLDVNAVDKSGETPLGLALRLDVGDTAILIALLAAGADPTIATTESQYTPLHRAAEKAAVPELECLVIKAASKLDVAMVSEPSFGLYGQTALWIAVRGGHQEAARILLEHGADPSVTCAHPECPTPLWAAYMSGLLEMAELLLKHKTNAKSDTPIADQVDRSGRTILHRTWEPCFAQWAPLLLRHNAKAGGIQDHSGREPVHYAALRDQQQPGKTIQLLLQGHACLDAQDGTSDWTPLMMASNRGDARLVAQLLFAGAGWRHVDGRGRDAFYLACKAGDTESAGHLLLRGAGCQLNKKAKLGRRPLHVAARYGHLDMVKWLLRYGAEKDAVLDAPFDQCTVAGTPAEVAREVGHEEVALAIDWFKDDGRSPLWDLRLLNGNP